MDKSQERRYRQIKINLPEHVAWKIERRVGKGTENIKAVAKIFLHYFANGKADLGFTFDLSEKEIEKVITELEKQKGKEAA